MTSSPAVQELVPLRTHVCLPGDAVLSLSPGAVVALGGGLRALPARPHPFPHPSSSSSSSFPDPSSSSLSRGGDSAAQTVVAEFCGAASSAGGGARRYAIEAPAARRYACRAGDPVVATIVRAAPTHYACSTGGPALAALDALAFDGATRTSRPRLQAGDVVYAVVRACAADEDAEISCAAGDAGLAAKDWTSGEAVFGPLEGGTVIRVALPFARALMQPGEAGVLLARIGERVPFEVCVGMNGIVWVKGQESAADPTAGVRRTVAIAACITEAQTDATVEEMEARVKSYFPNNDSD